MSSPKSSTNENKQPQPSTTVSQYKVHFPVKAYDGVEFMYEGPLTPGQLHGIISMMHTLFDEDFPSLAVKILDGSQDEVNVEYALSKVQVHGEVDQDEVPDDWASSFEGFEYAALYTPAEDKKILVFYTEDDNLEGIHTAYNHYEEGITRSNAQLFPSIKDKQNATRKVIQ